MSRPEHLCPPEIVSAHHKESISLPTVLQQRGSSEVCHQVCTEENFENLYNSTRMLEIQTKMTERAVELLNLPNDSPKFILDIGCGTGLSGKVLEKHGHYWIGTDISRSMLGELFSGCG